METVSPLINWITTLLLFVTLDQGGTAIKLEAVDSRTNLVMAQLNLAEWVPLDELSEKISLASVTKQFIDQLPLQ